MIRLALLRHGHTAWNRAGRIQGRSDIPLDAEARADLATRRLPPPWDTAKLVASPLIRAQDTAHLVGQRAPDTVSELIEMNWGTWEGQQGKLLRDTPESGFRDIEHWGWTYRPPGGESPAEVRERLQSWLHSLQADTVAVTHIGIMRVLMAQATGWDFDGPAPFQIKRNRLFLLTWDGHRLTADTEPLRLLQDGAT